MLESWIESLFISFAVTSLLESAAAYIAGIRSRKEYLLLFLVNLFTNPLTVLLYILVSSYTRFPVGLTQLILEICVIGAEGVLFEKCSSQIENPWVFSLRINGFSYIIGVLLQVVL